jgi:hypothetical protein
MNINEIEHSPLLLIDTEVTEPDLLERAPIEAVVVDEVCLKSE